MVSTPASVAMPSMTEANQDLRLLWPLDRMFPLKVGDELFIDAPGAKENEKIHFLCDISFGEPGIMEGDWILETVQGMSDLVAQIAADFEALFV